ncbi:retrovirus-related pol polyprotein from transposon TNT 1-94 [Tanacetum coccineum]
MKVLIHRLTFSSRMRTPAIFTTKILLLKIMQILRGIEIRAVIWLWIDKWALRCTAVTILSIVPAKFTQDLLRVCGVGAKNGREGGRMASILVFGIGWETGKCGKKRFRRKFIIAVRKQCEIVQICLWIIDSGCSKRMTSNRALLMNFVEKFLGTVRFGNNDFTVIVGYGDVVIRSMMIKKKGCRFCLPLCHSSNFGYTIALNEIASNSLACLLAKASSSQSWLWHQRLSHLNFSKINNLMKSNLVRGLLKMKFEKDHLCSACEQGKIHQKHHKSKMDFASNKQLYLLYMDLCGPMRVESINEKRYVLVFVDDYSRTEFKNKTLAKFFDEVGITQQFSAARTPQQNGVVERRNRTLVEDARTICYLLNDYDDVGKLKEKGDIGVFVRFSKESVASEWFSYST